MRNLVEAQLTRLERAERQEKRYARARGQTMQPAPVARVARVASGAEDDEAEATYYRAVVAARLVPDFRASFARPYLERPCGNLPVDTQNPGPVGVRGSDVLHLVGARGFEPPTPTTPLWCATRLRYAPTYPHLSISIAATSSVRQVAVSAIQPHWPAPPAVPPPLWPCHRAY
jgi:hypothetical protein